MNVLEYIDFRGCVSSKELIDVFGIDHDWQKEFYTHLYAGTIKIEKTRFAERFYRTESTPEEDRAEDRAEKAAVKRVPVKRISMPRKILEYVREHPGLNGEEIALGMNISKDALKYLRKLVADGKVSRVKEGVAYKHYVVGDKKAEVAVLPLDKQLVIYLEEHKFKTPVELYEHFKPEDEDAFFALIDELVESKKITVDDDGTLFVH